MPSSLRCNLFTYMITACGLIDLGFTGPSFTWCNKRKGLAKVQERIDRAMANSDWRLLYPEAAVIHLPRVHSDHCPVLLTCEPRVAVDTSKRPFRFHSMWLTHPELAEFVGVSV